MAGEIDLSENKLRKKIDKVATKNNNEKLADVSQKGCITDIVNEIVESGDAKPVVTGFFRGYPHGKEIASNILMYGGNDKDLKDIMRAIGRVLYWTKDIYATRDLAIYAGKNNGKELGTVLQNIGNIALWIEDGDVIHRVVDFADGYKGKKLDFIMGRIEKIGDISDDPEMVKKSLEVAKKYKGIVLERAMNKLVSVAYSRNEFNKAVERYLP